MSKERIEEIVPLTTLSMMFGDFEIYREGVKCDLEAIRDDDWRHDVFEKDVARNDIVRIPNRKSEKVPDLAFSRRLPKMYDGSFLDPTKMMPVSLTLLGRILGVLPAYIARAEVLFGNQYPDGTLLLGGATPCCALIKITWDVETPRFVGGKAYGGEDANELEMEIRRQIGDALSLVSIIDDSGYGMCGEVYVLISDIRSSHYDWGDALLAMCEEHEAWIRRLLKKSAERLEKFEAEKEVWHRKILELIPENWVRELQGRREIIEFDDRVRLEEKGILAFSYNMRVEARYDEVGHEKIKKLFSDRVVSNKSGKTRQVL